MKIAFNQPAYLPWTGFVFKAIHTDLLVILDSTQLPHGGSWIYRNRIKGDSSAVWLSVPLKRKGRGAQLISDVVVFNERKWQKKHLETIKHCYANAPYLDEYLELLEQLYTEKHEKLVSLTMKTIDFFLKSLKLDTQVLMLSEMGIKGKGSELLVSISKQAGAKTLVFPSPARKYLDLTHITNSGFKVKYYQFIPPVYPQLRGEFIYNLSTLDLLLNCGPVKTVELIRKSGKF